LVERADWNGLVSDQRRADAEIRLVAPLRQSTAGGSGAFLARADDGERYWVKTLNNCQSARVPATEQLVGRAGAAIGAPVCEVRTLHIGAEFHGWEFRPGRSLVPGIAHASRHVENSRETHHLEARGEDENDRRHAYLLALYDWCWGNDPQWLMALDQENKFFSHDHGHYLPGGPNWRSEQLERSVDVEHAIDPGGPLSLQAVREVAEKIRAVDRAMIIGILRDIPREWPVSDSELEAVGFFLERRAEQVAQRLLLRFGGRV
jgi:hypothetical protein